jgi:ATP-dependent DNA ligase
MEMQALEYKAENMHRYKPKMKRFKSFSELPFNGVTAVASAKADGEMAIVRFDGKTAVSINLWDMLRYDFLALNQMTEAFKKNGVRSAELLCECHSMDNGRPMRNNELRHILLGLKDEKRIYLSPWDILSMDCPSGLPSDYADKLDLLDKILYGCSNAMTLPHQVVRNTIEAAKCFERWADNEQWEGVVYRMGDKYFKKKPIETIDAVVLGIYKKTKGYSSNLASSLLLGLRLDNNVFVEIGNCVVNTEELRQTLWQLNSFKVGEDSNYVYVKPFMVVEVDCYDAYESLNSSVYQFDDSLNRLLGISRASMVSGRLRSPQIKNFRGDKQPTVDDIGIQQIEGLI